MSKLSKAEKKGKATAEKTAKAGGWNPRIAERQLASGTAWQADWWEKQSGGGYSHRKKQLATRAELDTWIEGEQKKRASENKIIQRAERRGDNVVTLANLSPAERAALAAAVETIRKAGGRVESIVDASIFFVKTQMTGAKVTVAELLAEHLETMRKQGKRPPTIRDRRLYLADFLETYGDALAATVTKAQAEDWVFDADTPSKQASRRRALHALFNYATGRDYVERNPVSKVEKPRELGPDRITLFTPVEAETVLRAAEIIEPRLVPYLAIGIFAGLRPQNELRGLDWGNVNLDAGLLTVTRRTSKTARVRHVPISENLAAWLRSVPKAERVGPLFYSRRFMREIVEVARVDAKGNPAPFKMEDGKAVFKKGAKLKPVQWGADIMRHTFCSYRQAVIKNIAQLCEEAGNTAPIARAHYLSPRASEAEVEAFWSIMPARKGKCT